MNAAASAVDGIPGDAGLPQLRTLLDPDAMAAVLARRLAPGRSVGSVGIAYLRYKPGTRLIARYAVELDDGVYDAHSLAEPAAGLARWVDQPTNIALAELVDGRSPAREPLAYEPDVDALIQWLPLDISLPALARPSAELRRILRARGVDVARNGREPRLLAFKARRRAVLELDGHVVKIYAGGREFDDASRGLRASERVDGLRVPGCEAVIPELRLTCQTRLDRAASTSPDAREAVAGAALALVHRSRLQELRPFPPAAQLAAAAASARSVTAVVPALERRVTELMSRLERQTPSPLEPVPAHGDFHANQLLELDAGLALIDFDELCAAPAALDFSSYAAHVLTGATGELEQAAAALDRLVDGYGARPPALGWYVATSIVRRAPFPFRFMDDDWPRRIEQMIGDAEEALRL